MSHVEVLIALKAKFPTHPLLPTLLKLFQSHASGARAVQDPSDGRWHQVLDDSSAWLETSSSAMFLWSFITGVQHGFLSKSEYDGAIHKAWSGLLKTIQSDGVVNGISQETGIGSTPAYYLGRSTNYMNSRSGLGAVLKAIAAYSEYTN